MQEAPFEIGPIRPPSEATSLLVRVSRNCPWNRCTFCPVYKGQRFSLRSVEGVKADIDALAEMAHWVAELYGLTERGAISPATFRRWLYEKGGREAVQVALFVHAGGKSIFLQDANSLIVPVDALAAIVEHLRRSFPSVTRITTYARSHTVVGRTVDDLSRLREAGLNRVHIGLESGSDRILELVQKGVTSARHIEAGLRVKVAGMELSEYVMPGLGGRRLSREHARETARVLRAIDPDFIRLRSLTIAPGSPLEEALDSGEFEPLGQVEVVEEIRALIEGLTNMTGFVRSDHILNLLEEVEGRLPDDRERMLATIDGFLSLPPDDRDLFVVGRRLGWLRRLGDLAEPGLRVGAALALRQVRRRCPGDLDRAILALTRTMV